MVDIVIVEVVFFVYVYSSVINLAQKVQLILSNIFSMAGKCI